MLCQTIANIRVKSCPKGKCCFPAHSFIVSGSPSNPILEGGDLNALPDHSEHTGQTCPKGECCFAANSFIVSDSPSNPMLGGGDLNPLEQSQLILVEKSLFMR